MTMRDDDDAVLAPLGELPRPDVDDVTRERIRRRAQAVLARERDLAARPWLRRADRAYSRVIEPLVVAATCSVYLAWALKAAAALYR